MKCVHCKRDSRRRERLDGACPGCRHPFALDPGSKPHVTDMAFQNAIDAVSANSTVRFLEDHLYYELARRLNRRKRLPRIFFGVTGAVLLVGGLFATPLLIGAAGAGLVAWLQAPPRTLTLSAADFKEMLERWKRVHGAPRMLIVRKPQEGYRKAPAHAELEHYSFDRAVICDRAETVDVLLANNFHFENNCAVLSHDGYPQRAFDTVLAMLRKNPKLSVYVVHDATVRGCTLAHELANHPKWFKGTARVVEVGIRPVHAKKFVGLWRSVTLQVEPGRGISDRDAAWLGKYALDLAAIRPEQVIKRVFRAMTATQATETEDGYWIDDIAVSGGGDGGGGDVGIGDDSFG